MEQQELTPEQQIWAAHVNLAAMATLWQSVPDEEKLELLEEVLETYSDEQIWAYTVLYTESLGFDVQGLPTVEGDAPLDQYEPEANANAELTYDSAGQLHTGLYL